MDKFNKVVNIVNELKNYQVFCVYFATSLILAALLQLVIIPAFLGFAHDPVGLVVPDSIGFHQEAVDLAQQMKDQGVGVWTIKDELNSPAHIVALFYYLLWQEPYVVLPYNALLHALAGFMVYLLLQPLFRLSISAIMGGFFFVLNPVAYEWVAQIHRDGLFIVGNLACLLGWVYLFRAAWGETLKLWAYGVLLCLCSGVCIWLTRDYWNEVMFVLCFILLIFSAILSLLSWRQTHAYGKRKIGFLMIGFFLMIYYFMFPDEEPMSIPSVEDYKVQASQELAIVEMQEMREMLEVRTVQEIQEEKVVALVAKILKSEEPVKQGMGALTSESVDVSASVPYADDRREEIDSKLAELAREKARVLDLSKALKDTYAKSKKDLLDERARLLTLYEKLQAIRQELTEEKARLLREQKWISSHILPTMVEEKLQAVALRREGTAGTIGKTNIDTEIKLNSVCAFVLYIPRALQIGLFSPFPNSLQGDGSGTYSTLGKKLFHFLSYLYYMLTACLFILLLCKCKHPLIWYICIFALLSILVFTYTYANVGTLNRLRYGFHTLLLATGFAYFAELLLVVLQKYKILNRL